MPIQVTCDKCQTVVSASASKAGQRAKCPKCGAQLLIPAADAPISFRGLETPAKPQPVAAKKTTPTGPKQPAGPDLNDVDLSLPLGPDLNAPAASLSKPSSNWSGKKGWKDVPTWVWFARGGAAVVALLVLLQVVLYGIKLVSQAGSNPVDVAQDPASTTLPDNSTTPTTDEKKLPQSSGFSTRPLVASQEKAPSSQDTVASVPTTSPAAGNKTLLDLINAVADSIVQITVFDSLGREIDAGIGFVIDPSGLVATNFHVVAKAHIARVKFPKGAVHDITGYRAYDEARDLAIVELAAVSPGLIPLKLQTVEWPKPGSEVIAVGNATGKSSAFVSGVVSNVQTTIELPTAARHFLRSPDDNTWIQTTAVLAGGKTGGPLLNRQGEVIGVNTWSAQSQKLTFASHVRHLKNLFDQLKSDVASFDTVNGAAKQRDKFHKYDPQIAAMLDEFRKNYDAFNDQLKTQTQAGRPQQEVAQFVALKNPVPIFAEKLFVLADEKRKQPLALEALTSVCELLQLPGAYSAPIFLRATSRIAEDHLNDPKMGGMLADITHSANNDALTWLRQVAQKSNEPQVAGPACYVLANALQQTQPSAAAREQEIVALLERAIRDYADVPLHETTLGKAASTLLFEVQHLSVGKQAPEIVGHDLAGKEFNLSEFGGKVVVIDFFADWSPNCSSMYIEERTLVAQLKDKPFALLGVNLDSKEQFRRVLSANQITWPCWWDGPEGPIASQWNVRTVPTMFVLDRKGIIRYKFHGVSAPVLADAIQKLLNPNRNVLPDDLQPASDGDLQAELEKLAVVAGTQPYPAVANAAVLLIQTNRSKTTKQHLTLIEGWIKKGLELEPDSLSLQLAHNRLQQFQGNANEAIKQLRELLKRSNLSKQELATLRFELARLLVTQNEKADKDAAEGLMLIEEAIFAGNATPEMTDTRAMAYLANNMLPNARADIASVISNKPGPMPYFHLALIESAASNAQGAKDALNRAITLGLTVGQLTPFEQKQYQRLARTLGVPLRK